MKRQAGFTLLEILVALMLFAAVGGALLQLYQLGLRQVHDANAYIHASLLARAKLNELQALETLQAGESSGEFDDGYRWYLQVGEAKEFDQPNHAPVTPMNLSLRIAWGPQENGRSLRMETLLLSRRYR